MNEITDDDDEGDEPLDDATIRRLALAALADPRPRFTLEAVEGHLQALFERLRAERGGKRLE